MAVSEMRVKRLARAIKPSYDKLKPFREMPQEIMRQYVGPHYGEAGSKDARPVNMLEMALTQYRTELSSTNPQVLCSTHVPELRSAATELELALNETLKRMDFSAEHKLWVMSALIGVGIMQVGMETISQRVIDGEIVPETNVFVETIAIDDWVHDVSAKKWNNRQVTFCGHRYLMPLEDVKENEMYDKEVRSRLGKKDKHPDDEMASMSTGTSEVEDVFVEMVELWDIWVPADKTIVTFVANEMGTGVIDKPLRQIDWEGPPHGPYHLFGFNPVINNVMPLSPASNWYDIDDLMNKLVVQMGVDASRAKNIGLTSSATRSDAETIRTTENGQIAVVDNPTGFTTQTIGGVNQQTLGFSQVIKQLVSYSMGNLDAIAGLASQAGTLGQEEIIKSSSNARVQAMQTAVAEATRAVIRDIAYYLHNLSTQELSLTMKVGESTVALTWPYQEDEYGIEFDSREGEIWQYHIDIVPYSMTSLPPGARAQQLERIWQQIVLPVIGSGMQPPDGFIELLKQLAKLYNMPEIASLYKTAAISYEQQQMQQQNAGNRMPKPVTSSREYVRTSRSAGMSPQAADQQMMLAAMGAGGSNNRPTGAA